MLKFRHLNPKFQRKLDILWMLGFTLYYTSTYDEFMAGKPVIKICQIKGSVSTLSNQLSSFTFCKKIQYWGHEEHCVLFSIIERCKREKRNGQRF